MALKCCLIKSACANNKNKVQPGHLHSLISVFVRCLDSIIVIILHEIEVQETFLFDVYETLCPQQMLVHKGGQIMNWSGECKDIIPTKLQCQTIQRTLQSPNLQREIIRKKIKKLFFKFFTN